MHADDSKRVVAQLREMHVNDEPAFDRQAWLEQHESPMRRSLEALETNQSDIDKLMAALSRERRDLEMKYEALLGPHYQFRMKIVRGEGVPQSHGSSTTTGIPGFWLKVLQAHPEIEDRISGKDAMVLQHLVGIIGSRLKPAQGSTKAYGFALKFYFTPNDFFTEEELSLDVTFADEDQTIVKGIKGTRISWTSPGKNPTIKLKKKGGATGRHQVRSEAAESFFTLFESVKPPDEGTIDIHEYEAMKQEAEDCLAITMTLMEDMIPHAAKYFSGEKTFEPEFDDSTELDDEDEGIHIEESEDDNEDRKSVV